MRKLSLREVTQLIQVHIISESWTWDANPPWLTNSEVVLVPLAMPPPTEVSLQRPAALSPLARSLHVPDLEDWSIKRVSLLPILIFLTAPLLPFQARQPPHSEIKVGSQRAGYLLYAKGLNLFPIFLLIYDRILWGKTENLQKSR